MPWKIKERARSVPAEKMRKWGIQRRMGRYTRARKHKNTKNAFIMAAYMIIVVNLPMASFPASKLATRFMIRQAMTIRAGPAAKADARNRGAVIADSQKWRPGRPQ